MVCIEIINLFSQHIDGWPPDMGVNCLLNSDVLHILSKPNILDSLEQRLIHIKLNIDKLYFRYLDTMILEIIFNIYVQYNYV